MMKSENITFVVQGPVRNETKDTLESIRLNFKEAKIILSTWEGSN
ncbi:TPA: wavE lipopolysaccharide synthesis family protein, partial [Escherichia coli]|nr:wavE lipopolysaccharide synthesis family protein [Escherichia coli]